MADIEKGKSLDVLPPLRPPLLRRPWVQALVGTGLFLIGACIALAIALPLTLRDKDNGSTSLYALSGTNRTYYLAAEPVTWDYLPYNVSNNCLGANFTDAEALTTTQGYGHILQKAVYRHYTDATFQTPMTRTGDDVHLGLYGPKIVGAVGDTINVVLYNKLPFQVNIEPDGVNYESPIGCNTNQTVTYQWTVPQYACNGQAGNATSCMWLYRSTVDVTGHTYAGLVGPLITSNRGALVGNATVPSDVDQEFMIIISVTNEALSAFADINTAGNTTLDAADIPESLLKHSVNGMSFCNLPGLNTAVGRKVRWHIASVGSEEDIHSAHWHGITLNYKGYTQDQIMLQPGVIGTLDSTMDDPGTWLFHCHVNKHMDSGMAAFFNVAGDPIDLTPQLTGVTRNYYIAAVQQEWNYAPLGGDVCGDTAGSGGGLEAAVGEGEGAAVVLTGAFSVYNVAGPDRVGSKWQKALFVEYTDATFTTVKARSVEDQHLGLLGPIMRAEVGDTMVVTFKNMVPNHNITVHPHGVHYTKANEGSPYNDGTTGANKGDDYISTNETYTYTWHVLERSGPGVNDPSSLMWLYHSHHIETMDTYAGLMGALIVTRKGMANGDGSPQDVGKEFVLLFSVVNEMDSFLFDVNMKTYLPNITKNATALDVLVADPNFQESTLHHSINGYMYCNQPGLTLVQGQTARFYFMAFGTIADLHTPFTSATQIDENGERKQAIQILPGAMSTTDVQADNPGTWLLKCHISDHTLAGMQAAYTVTDENLLLEPFNGIERTFYIAAVEINWDYAPLGYDGCTGQPFSGFQPTYIVTTNGTMGSNYTKSVYRQYTDATFTTQVPQPASHGFLGPLIHAEVGDKITIVFRNSLSGNYTAGIKMSAGMVPGGNYSASLLINPGEQITYTWVVPQDAGPGPMDSSTIAYTYTSGENDQASTLAGLVGIIAIGNRGSIVNNMPKDVDFVAPMLFNVMDESGSPYFAQNIAADEGMINATIDQNAVNFGESNLMHSINGYVFCNIPELVFRQGMNVRFYLFGMGTEDGTHSPVFSGQQLLQGGKPIAVAGLMPALTQTVDMPATNLGTWHFYCYVLDHLLAGMEGRIVVTPPS